VPLSYLTIFLIESSVIKNNFLLVLNPY